MLFIHLHLFIVLISYKNLQYTTYFTEAKYIIFKCDEVHNYIISYTSWMGNWNDKLTFHDQTALQLSTKNDGHNYAGGYIHLSMPLAIGKVSWSSTGKYS